MKFHKISVLFIYFASVAFFRCQLLSAKSFWRASYHLIYVLLFDFSCVSFFLIKNGIYEISSFLILADKKFVLFYYVLICCTHIRSDTWVLEFVDFGGEMRRDVWYACISEVIALYKFIREFGPEEGDPSAYNVYGSQKGKARAISYATNAVKRLQALQYARKLLEEPTKLVQFSYLYNAPYGDVVLQTLAVNCWGGPLIAKITDQDYQSGGSPGSTNDTTESSSYVFDIDGSVYLQKWMKSPSWASSASLAFWKNPRSKRGIVFSKNLVVADINLMEKAALICRDKYQVVEKTQATIDAAMIEGIPSNIDLFKVILSLSFSAVSVCNFF